MYLFYIVGFGREGESKDFGIDEWVSDVAKYRQV
jgi:hypothetical protein